MTRKAVEVNIVPLPANPPWILPDATVDFITLEQKKRIKNLCVIYSSCRNTLVDTTVTYRSTQMHQKIW